MNEFDLIADLFAPLATAQGAFGLLDDAAVFSAPEGCETVITKDVMIEGVHFLNKTSADRVARKLLRVNLSDLAAMGATPKGYLLGCQFPGEVSDDWLRSFAAGLAEDQASFGISLLGGDTTRTPGPMAFSLTAIGSVPKGHAILRSGAKPGDEVWVSGTIGDGALGLKVALGTYAPKNARDAQWLLERLELPAPRLALGQTLRGIASAMIDVSDGLAADVGHIAKASGVAITLDAETVPLSEAATAALNEGQSDLVALLSGGDDYELAFTAPASARTAIDTAAGEAGVAVTCVGRVLEGKGGVAVLREGQPLELPRAGYRHF